MHCRRSDRRLARTLCQRFAIFYYIFTHHFSVPYSHLFLAATFFSLDFSQIDGFSGGGGEREMHIFHRDSTHSLGATGTFSQVFTALDSKTISQRLPHMFFPRNLTRGYCLRLARALFKHSPIFRLSRFFLPYLRTELKTNFQGKCLT